MITKIIKRDGREANFDTEKITQAIYKAAQAIGGNDYDAAKDVYKRQMFEAVGAYTANKISAEELCEFQNKACLLYTSFIIGFFVAMPLHEFLQAISYPKGAKVYIGVSLKQLRAYAASSAAPVSYTHLDVYKRQVLFTR